MELYKGILREALAQTEIKVTFENLELRSAGEIVEKACYIALNKIKEAVEDDELSDFDCIEKIIEILDSIGCETEWRHDF